MKTRLLILAFLILITASHSVSAPILQTAKFNGNNFCTYFNNFGVFNQNMGNSNTAGLLWHCQDSYCFTSGLNLCAYVDGRFTMYACSYRGELVPGYIRDSVFITNSDFKIYKVSPHDSPWQNPDFANWYKMVPFGAPYEDINNNCIFEPGIDRPGIKGAEQTVFICMTDMDISNHTGAEGFGGGILDPLLKAEIRLTSWGYNLVLSDIQYFKFEIINKNKFPWDSAYFGLFSDPDIPPNLGAGEFIGCDTVRNLGYAYSADTTDVSGSFGIRILRGPVNKQTGDTLNMTGFSHSGFNISPCEYEAIGNGLAAYNYIKGFKGDRTPYMNPVFNPPIRTKFVFSGDPETNTGWTPDKGYIANCYGNDTGQYIPKVYGRDSKFHLGMGADNFRIFPNDTQHIFFAQMIAKGTSNKNSVSKLKQLSDIADYAFKNEFEYNSINCKDAIFPDDYTISQNYPNPFNNSTTIQFTVPRSSYIKIAIFDLLGREVARPVDGQVPAGWHQVNFSAANLASGIYFYRLTAVDNTYNGAVKQGKFQKMVLIK